MIGEFFAKNFADFQTVTKLEIDIILIKITKLSISQLLIVLWYFIVSKLPKRRYQKSTQNNMLLSGWKTEKRDIRSLIRE